MNAGGPLANAIYAVLDRVRELLYSEVGAVLAGDPPVFTEPGVEVEEAFVQLISVNLYMDNFDHNARFFQDLNEQAARIAADCDDRYLAEIALAVADRYPDISWLIGAETVRHFKKDLCGATRRLDRGLPDRHLYRALRHDGKKLARLIKIAWKGGGPCPLRPPPDHNKDLPAPQDQRPLTDQIRRIRTQIADHAEKAIQRDKWAGPLATPAPQYGPARPSTWWQSPLPPGRPEHGSKTP